MADDHLLPPNATALERALSLAMDGPGRIGARAGLIATAKRIDIPNDVIPWLVWEYGLGELLPWIPNPRQAIAEGILWQRLRGTPAALVTALGWIGFLPDLIEEEVPGEHFAEFLIDTGAVPDGAGRVTNIAALARLSAPARSRLARLYHGHDLRRFIADQSDWGDPLSHYSGVWDGENDVWLSFGRWYGYLADRNIAEVRGPERALTIARGQAVHAPYQFILDDNLLGDGWHVLNGRFVHGHVFTQVNDAPVPFVGDLERPWYFAKAEIVLSDSWALDDINACLPARFSREIGGAFQLGEDRLSEHEWSADWTPIDERFARRTGFDSAPVTHGPGSLDHYRNNRFGSLVGRDGWPVLDEPHEPAFVAIAIATITRGRAAAPTAQHWTSARWPGQSWNAAREIIGVSHGRSDA